jgi:hypothetical protein
MVKLTPEQHQALLESGPEPLRLMDPQNGVVYLLIPQTEYERFQNLANAL